jgi:hypothetical protein
MHTKSGVRKSDLRTILAGWIREIVEAQPASFQTLSEEGRKALLEREITRRFHAEYNANSEVFASSCDSETRQQTFASPDVAAERE